MKAQIFPSFPVLKSDFLQPFHNEEAGAQSRGRGAAEGCWGRMLVRDAGEGMLPPFPPTPPSPGSGWAVSVKLFEESLESPLLTPDSCQN